MWPMLYRFDELNRRIFILVIRIIEYGFTNWHFRASDSNVEPQYKGPNSGPTVNTRCGKIHAYQSNAMKAGIIPIQHRLLQRTLRQELQPLNKLNTPLRIETISLSQETA